MFDCTFMGSPLPSALAARSNSALCCRAAGSPLCSGVLNGSPPAVG